MTATQFAGIAYRDVFASVVPEPLQLSGYVITYPYAYGGTLFRANAWVGLEPSFVSFQLGLAALAAMMVRRSWLVLALILAGLASTASGSGILILLVGVAGLVSSRLRGQLSTPPAPPGARNPRAAEHSVRDRARRAGRRGRRGQLLGVAAGHPALRATTDAVALGPADDVLRRRAGHVPGPGHRNERGRAARPDTDQDSLRLRHRRGTGARGLPDHLLLRLC